MQILKQLWSKKTEDTEVCNTYEYVLQLRKRLESTLKIAQDSLGKMSRKYKRYYNRKAGNRKLKVNDKALILPPTKTNKCSWDGKDHMKL